MFVEYVVWRATENDMVQHAKFKTLEEAKFCADMLRKVQHGTIYVERIMHEHVYYA